MKKLDNFSNSLKVLKTVDYDLVRDNDIYRAGVVHQFGLTFDLSWKALQSMLREHGVVEAQTGSPRAIIKIAYQCNMIGDEQTWLEILEARNILSHTYSDEQSMSVIDDIKNSFINAFDALKTELSEHWLGE